MMLQINGTNIQEGDHLGFFSEVKQYGEIVVIHGDWITLKSLDPRGFSGKSIGGKKFTTVHTNDTWIAQEHSALALAGD